MQCVTQEIYQKLRSQLQIQSIDEMSKMMGKSRSYLRCTWSKGHIASTDAMLNLYIKLAHMQQNEPDNLYLADSLIELKNQVWATLYERACNKLEACK